MAGVFVGALALGGCSSPTKYSPPETLCGIDVGERHTPLFPIDREARTGWSFEDNKEIYSGAWCIVRIGEETLIYSGSTIWAREDGAPPTYDHYREPSNEDPETVQGPGYEAKVWPRFAMAEIPCYAERDDYVIFVGIVANYPEDPDENQAALAELIVPYADSLFAQATICDLSEGFQES
jgi:hypothetical protein